MTHAMFGKGCWNERVCRCGTRFWARKRTQAYCSKECASRYSVKIRIFGQTGFKKLKRCLVCGKDKRLFDYDQGKNSSDVCFPCQHKQRYINNGLIPPLDVVAAITEARGKGTTVTYAWFHFQFGLGQNKTLKLVADLVTDGYLLGMGSGQFILGDTAIQQLGQTDTLENRRIDE